MVVNKRKAYNKLFMYVSKKYSDDMIEWGTDTEENDRYLMKAIFPDNTKRLISVNYSTMKITDIMI